MNHLKSDVLSSGTVQPYLGKKSQIFAFIFQNSFQMTVKTNYVIAIAMLGDWLKNVVSIFQQMGAKAKANCMLYTQFLVCFEQVIVNF